MVGVALLGPQLSDRLNTLTELSPLSEIFYLVEILEGSRNEVFVRLGE